MDNKKILEKIGLNEDELRHYLASSDEFLGKLGPKEKATLTRSQPNSSEAAALIGGDVSASDLERFMRDRAPSDSAVVAGYMLVRKS